MTDIGKMNLMGSSNNTNKEVVIRDRLDSAVYYAKCVSGIAKLDFVTAMMRNTEVFRESPLVEREYFESPNLIKTFSEEISSEYYGSLFHFIQLLNERNMSLEDALNNQNIENIFCEQKLSREQTLEILQFYITRYKDGEYHLDVWRWLSAFGFCLEGEEIPEKYKTFISPYWYNPVFNCRAIKIADRFIASEVLTDEAMRGYRYNCAGVRNYYCCGDLGNLFYMAEWCLFTEAQSRERTEAMFNNDGQPVYSVLYTPYVINGVDISLCSYWGGDYRKQDSAQLKEYVDRLNSIGIRSTLVERQ